MHLPGAGRPAKHSKVVAIGDFCLPPQLRQRFFSWLLLPSRLAADADLFLDIAQSVAPSVRLKNTCTADQRESERADGVDLILGPIHFDFLEMKARLPRNRQPAGKSRCRRHIRRFV